MDGMRPIYLQERLGSNTVEHGRRLLSALATFVNLLLRGTIPNYTRDTFFGVSLCALTKKIGGIRPFSVDCALRKLAARICAKYAIDLLQWFFSPKQLGVGASSGCEAAVHAARHYVFSPEHVSLHDVQFLIKVDLRNAFNK